VILTNPIDPPLEPCDPAPEPRFAAPTQFVVAGHENRLISELRTNAKSMDPVMILAEAAKAFYRAAHPSPLPAPQGSVALGNALADLAVTGRMAYDTFKAKATAPDEMSLRDDVATSLQLTSTEVAAAVSMALDRAYAVAWALRGPVHLRPALRARLGWIAVSGEDDKPHRPVNVSLQAVDFIPAGVANAAAARLPNGMLQVWATDNVGGLWTSWQYVTGPLNNPVRFWTMWSNFLDVAGPIPAGVASVAVAPLSNGALELWATDKNGGLWTSWKINANANADWTGWSDFLGEVGAIPAGVASVAVAPLSNGALELWATDKNGGLWTCWKVDSTPGANWTGWADFLAEVGAIPAGVANVAVAPLSNGALELWATDKNGGLWTSWKVNANADADWTGWSNFLAEVGAIPAGVASVAVAPLSNKALELWATDKNGAVWTSWKVDATPDANWTGWSNFLDEVGPIPAGVANVAASSAANPSVGIPANSGALQLWGIGSDGKPWTSWKVNANADADWTRWSEFNAVAGAFEEFEIPVDVVVPAAKPILTIQTRFIIASAVEEPVQGGIVPLSRAVPPEPVPHVPYGHQVILFLHGHSSSAEEALPIIPHILKQGLDQGRKYSVVSFDLPNNGYSQTFDHQEVAPASSTSWPSAPDDGRPIHAPILDYLENFVVAFVDTLDKITPIKHRFAGVIGGSLGGNLGLRLGQRDLTASPWLKGGIVSWSAACVWGPLVNSYTNSIAPGVCWGRSIQLEDDPPGTDSRNLYFQGVYDQAAVATTGTRTQPEMWYRDGWEPCKALHIRGSRLARQEIYDANLRQWHWRVACEQLIFSHVDHVDHDPNKPYRYALNKVRQLLVAGEGDNFAGTEIYKCTADLVRDGMAIVDTPGRCLLLKNTGHSVHLERPRYFAGEIVSFLPGVESSPLDISYLQPLLLEPERCDISFLGPLLLDPEPHTDISFLVPLLLSEPEPEQSADFSLLLPLLRVFRFFRRLLSRLVRWIVPAR
jgi:hypothetical protein